ncbi:hypothetical protein [Devosia sp.]|uniref:hypothetical protein n=1 Tax=Devosia sp. TaxID=1871048 RepID=UPI003F71AE47
MLLTHVTTSVAMLGAVGCFLVLAAVGLGTAETGPLVYSAMDLITRYVILPLTALSLILGIVQSLVTPWGLMRHYWVVLKLVLTGLVAVVLLMQTPNIATLAQLDAGALSSSEWLTMRFSMLLHAGGGLFVLLLIAVLSIYKPRGLTRYGWKKAKQLSGSGAHSGRAQT